jgi:hypothetical protein
VQGKENIIKVKRNVYTLLNIIVLINSFILEFDVYLEKVGWALIEEL